ncbi:hypothetical protein WEI85_19895 [Actinomycetes bacterium KLBMP 9797]
MTPPTARYRVSPWVDYRMFVLRDPRSHPTPLEEGTPSADSILMPATHGVVLHSGGNLFHPHVDIEIWSHEPPAAEGEWDEIDEASFTTTSGTIRIESLSGQPEPTFALERPGPVRLRAHTKGRGEAMERLSMETSYEGVEEWLLQVWPDQNANGV